MAAAVGDVWFRFDDHLVSHGGIDECGDWVSSVNSVEVRLHKFRVVKVTRRGVRINTGKLICTGWNKKYAHPTVDDALVSYKARKRRQIGIYQTRLRDAQKALALANEGKFIGLNDEVKVINPWI